jgi:hypothetical protein
MHYNFCRLIRRALIGATLSPAASARFVGLHPAFASRQLDAVRLIAFRNERSALLHCQLFCLRPLAVLKEAADFGLNFDRYVCQFPLGSHRF